MTKAQRFFASVKDKRIAFIGVGVSHTELIKLFLSKGINVVVCDKKMRIILIRICMRNYLQEEQSFLWVKTILTRYLTAILFSEHRECTLTTILLRQLERPEL